MYANRAANIIANHDSDASRLFLYAAFQNIHGPHQVPQEYLDELDGVFTRDERTVTASMTLALDAAIKTIRDALEDAGMLDESIIVFASDNGGQPVNGAASNTPLR